MTTSFKPNRIIGLGVVVFMSVSSAAFGYYNQATDGVPVKHAGDVTYVTGGIGEEERAELESMQREYNLRIMNSERSGVFSGDTKVVIYDRVGNEVLTADSGPLFYAHLPAGKYVVAAENEGRIQKKSVKVGANAAIGSDLHLVWN